MLSSTADRGVVVVKGVIMVFCEGVRCTEAFQIIVFCRRTLSCVIVIFRNGEEGACKKRGKIKLGTGKAMVGSLGGG